MNASDASPDAPHRANGPRAAAFFDVDETLISVKSMFRFLEYHLRVMGAGPDAYPAARDRLLTQAAGTTRAVANRAYYELYAGVSSELLSAHGRAWCAEEISRPAFFHPALVERFRRHRRAGHLTVLVSGSFLACLQPIADHLGADEILCSVPLIADGRYTGAVGRTMIGTTKGMAAGEMMSANGLLPEDCYAYGDHASDLPLLEIVGHPVVVGTDPELAGRAERYGWPRIERPDLPERPAAERPEVAV
jgi:HAD superfamily hydrolase (TIGR01490 family)